MMRKGLWSTVGSFTASAGIAALSLTGVHRNVVHAAESAHATGAKAYTTWSDYEGGSDSAQYSSLKQINKANVRQLKQAWFFPAGNNGFRFGSNPIVVDHTMYVIGPSENLVAVDAATGKEIWTWQSGNPTSVTNRGVNYWESKDRRDRRIFYATDNNMHAIDAQTGKLILTFGNQGNVDLREGLERDPNTIRHIQSGTPGRIFENLLILGSSTGENYGSSPGDVRAYDVVTGKMVWSFHTIPHPGEMGYNTWPKDAWKYIGGVNDWGGMTIDEKRGFAYFPLGSPTYDFYGADRAGANLFSDCLLALDARTGKYLWHFQEVHHDLWDYDFTTSPKLFTIRHNGKTVDVVAEPGKTGFLYVFDRVTGKPLWPIEERPVLQSTMTGEQSWPTQPFPTRPVPFARQTFTVDDINPYIASAAEREKIRAEMLAANNKGLFTPPDLINTIEPAGNSGGSNWGSTATDPTTGFIYVVSKDAPTMLKLETKPPQQEITGSPSTRGRAVYIQNCLVCHTSELKGQPPSIPSLIGVVDRVGVDRITNIVRNGAPPMPAFPEISASGLNNLLAYLKAPETAHIPPAVLARLMAPPLPPIDDGSPVRYYSGYGYMNSTDNLPAIKPPWSTITAYDLNQGTLKWQIPVGTVTEVVNRGITAETGSFWPRGGPAVTAGGLIFIGTHSDGKVWAYDKDTGKTLWSAQLPADPEGIPAVYQIDGQEYVVFSASRHHTVIGDEPDAASARQPAQSSSPAKAETETQGYYVFTLPGIT